MEDSQNNFVSHKENQWSVSKKLEDTKMNSKRPLKPTSRELFKHHDVHHSKCTGDGKPCFENFAIICHPRWVSKFTFSKLIAMNCRIVPNYSES